jgi:type I restriction enzyme S subunit
MKKYKLKDVCKIEKGKIGITKAIEGEYPLVVTAEERSSHNEWHFDEPATIVPLVSSTGHGHASIKRLHYEEGKYAVGTILATLIPEDHKFLNAKYLYVYLTINKEELLVSQMTGAANVSLTLTRLKEVEVEIPDYDTQRSVVSQYEKLEGFKANMLSQIQIRNKILEKLHLQILQGALTGKLSEEWRKENPYVESAEVLFEKIRAEKKYLVKEKKIGKQKSLPPVSSEETPMELPNTWIWCRLGEIVQHNSGKTLNSGRNRGKLREYITTSNLYWGYFDLTDVKQMPIRDNELKKCLVTRGDLLVCEGGEAGRSAIWGEDYDICIQNHIHRVRPFGKINNIYLYRVFEQISLSGEINKYRKGMGISNLSGKSLSQIIIPLPPVAEQQYIVSKIELLLEKLNQIKELNFDNMEDINLLNEIVLQGIFEK